MLIILADGAALVFNTGVHKQKVSINDSVHTIMKRFSNHKQNSMLVKTNTIDKKGRRIYKNVLTGEEGLIGHIYVGASTRSSRRHPVSLISKVKSNRKTTKGRRMYFQKYTDAKGKERTFKHLQLTPSAIERKVAVMSLFDRIQSLVSRKKAA